MYYPLVTPIIEFIYNEYEVNASTGDKLYQHEGEECAYVIEGKLEINLICKTKVVYLTKN